MERLKAMETNDSGFKLAELDLELRGPGEMYGVKQHGFSKLRVAKFSDKSLIDKTNKMAKELIGDDPNLDNYPKLEAKLNSLLNRQVEPN
jgi:ATP-dependent DNA helicase RecG